MRCVPIKSKIVRKVKIPASLLYLGRQQRITPENRHAQYATPPGLETRGRHVLGPAVARAPELQDTRAPECHMLAIAFRSFVLRLSPPSTLRSVTDHDSSRSGQQRRSLPPTESSLIPHQLPTDSRPESHGKEGFAEAALSVSIARTGTHSPFSGGFSIESQLQKRR